MSKVLLSLIVIIFLSGCVLNTKDPWPYWGDPTPLKNREKERLEWRKKRDEYLAKHPEIPKSQRDLIYAGVIGKGLTKEQVIVMYGSNPDKIETGSLKYDADEMWFYRGVGWNDYYYFKGDSLIKIDHRR
jgi:hypothetical protein